MLIRSANSKSQISRQSTLTAGRKIPPPRLPRFRIEKRQHPDRAATLGVFGRLNPRRDEGDTFKVSALPFRRSCINASLPGDANFIAWLYELLIDDLEAHLPGGAFDDAEGGFVVAGVQVFAFRVDDIQHLFARDLADLLFVRFF